MIWCGDCRQKDVAGRYYGSVGPFAFMSTTLLVALAAMMMLWPWWWWWWGSWSVHDTMAFPPFSPRCHVASSIVLWILSSEFWKLGLIFETIENLETALHWRRDDWLSQCATVYLEMHELGRYSHCCFELRRQQFTRYSSQLALHLSDRIITKYVSWVNLRAISFRKSYTLWLCEWYTSAIISLSEIMVLCVFSSLHRHHHRTLLIVE